MSSGPLIWVVLLLALTLNELVGDLERPFARSLVVCEEESGEANSFSGSERCADRLHVIGTGNRFSGSAQSLELLTNCVATLLVAAICDRLGRKVALLMGLMAVTLSCLLFVAATFSEQAAPTLFIIAQGLQGVLCLDMLVVVITCDLVGVSGADGPAIFTLKEAVVGAGELIGLVVGSAIESQELLNYRQVWLGVLGFSASCAGMALLLPETRHAKAAEEVGTLREELAREVHSYWELVTQKRVVFWMLVQAFLFGPLWCFTDIFPAMLMAFFGYTQAQQSVRIAGWSVLCIVCTPLCLTLCERVGYGQGFRLACVLRSVQLFAMGPALMGHWSILWSFLLMHALLGGQIAIDEALRARVVGPEWSAKFNALDQLCSFATSSVSAFAYGQLFDAKATSYVGRSSVVLFCLPCFAAGTLVYNQKVRAVFDIACAELTEESKERDAQEAKDGKAE